MRQNNDVLPTVFTVETSLACNLKCPECAMGGKMIDRSKGFMSLARFKIIADKARPFAKYFYLHLWGEPMLNPEIIPIIKYASKIAGTNISTNGLMLSNEGAEQLITSGVSDIIVSIDGFSQDIYEQYRVGGDVKKALFVLEMLQCLQHKHGSRTNIIPQFIVFKHNQHEMEKFRRFCDNLGLAVTFKAPYIRRNDSTFFYSDDPQFQRPHYSSIPELRAAMRGCPNPRDVFTVLLDGSVVLCCHDYEGITLVGNIFEQDVSEIWESSAYSELRQKVLSGHAPSFCLEKCMTYFLSNEKGEQKSRPKENEGAVAPAKQTIETKVNLCSGSVKLPGYINIDMDGTDICIDLDTRPPAPPPPMAVRGSPVSAAAATRLTIPAASLVRFVPLVPSLMPPTPFVGAAFAAAPERPQALPDAVRPSNGLKFRQS